MNLSESVCGDCLSCRTSKSVSRSIFLMSGSSSLFLSSGRYCRSTGRPEHHVWLLYDHSTCTLSEGDITTITVQKEAHLHFLPHSAPLDQPVAAGGRAGCPRCRLATTRDGLDRERRRRGLHQLIGRTAELQRRSISPPADLSYSRRVSDINQFLMLLGCIQTLMFWCQTSIQVHRRTRSLVCLTVVKAAVTQGAYDSAPPHCWRLELSEGQQPLHHTPATDTH